MTKGMENIFFLLKFYTPIHILLHDMNTHFKMSENRPQLHYHNLPNLFSG